MVLTLGRCGCDLGEGEVCVGVTLEKCVGVTLEKCVGSDLVGCVGDGLGGVLHNVVFVLFWAVWTSAKLWTAR